MLSFPRKLHAPGVLRQGCKEGQRRGHLSRFLVLSCPSSGVYREQLSSLGAQRVPLPMDLA